MFKLLWSYWYSICLLLGWSSYPISAFHMDHFQHTERHHSDQNIPFSENIGRDCGQLCSNDSSWWLCTRGKKTTWFLHVILRSISLASCFISTCYWTLEQIWILYTLWQRSACHDTQRSPCSWSGNYWWHHLLSRYMSGNPMSCKHTLHYHAQPMAWSYWKGRYQWRTDIGLGWHCGWITVTWSIWRILLTCFN